MNKNRTQAIGKATIVTLILLLIISCNQNKKTNISIHIENIKSDTVKLLLTPFGTKPTNSFKTFVLKNGKLNIDTLITEPQKGFILPNDMLKKLSNGESFKIPSKIIEFFVFPKDKITINGIADNFNIDYTLKGNLLNLQYNKYRKSILKSYTGWCKLFYTIEDNYAKGTNSSVINEMEKQWSNFRNSYKQQHLSFIENNPDLELSAFLLTKEQRAIILKYYPALNKKVKDADFGKILKSKIDTWNKVSIGTLAPDFEYPTYKNGTFKLSANRGKYIILDFWGSWCGACMLEMPKLKAFYNKNRNKIEIAGIAARDTKKNWIKAIQKNQMNWIQILNNKTTDDLVKKYGIEGFPTKVLINPQGKIVAIFLGNRDVFFQKIEKLLKQ